MKKGVIYVLTNPSFPEYVKIGYANDLERRLKELNRSECLPFAFRAYCVYEVGDRLKDKELHALIDKLNPDLRAIETFNGKSRIREFYNISAEDAYEILYSIASISGTKEMLKKVQADGTEITDEEMARDFQESGAVSYTEQNHLDNKSSTTINLYKELKKKILMLDDEIMIEPKKYYIAFKYKTNICDVLLQNSKLKIFINMKKGTLIDEDSLAQDISQKGHWGNGDYEFNLTDANMLEYAMDLIIQSFKAQL